MTTALLGKARSQALRLWRLAWLPFALNYMSMPATGFVPVLHTYRELRGFSTGRVLGVGWRRWVLFLHFPGAYGRRGFSVRWCNYFGTGDGG